MPTQQLGLHIHKTTVCFTGCFHSRSYIEKCTNTSKSIFNQLNPFKKPCPPKNKLTNQWGLCHDCRCVWQSFNINEREALVRLQSYRETNRYFGAPLSPYRRPGDGQVIIVRELTAGVKGGPRVEISEGERIRSLEMWVRNAGEIVVEEGKEKGLERAKRPSSSSSQETIWPSVERELNRGKGKKKDHVDRESVRQDTSYLMTGGLAVDLEPIPRKYGGFELQELHGSENRNRKPSTPVSDSTAPGGQWPASSSLRYQGQAKERAQSRWPTARSASFRQPLRQSGESDMDKPLPRPPRPLTPMPEGQSHQSELIPELHLPSRVYVPRFF